MLRTGTNWSTRGGGATAFTLIELMVVMVALAVVAAAIVPALRGAGGRGDLDGAAARVAATARYAREAADEKEATVVLLVETEPALVHLVVEGAEDASVPASTFAPMGAPDQASLTPLPGAYARLRLPSGVTAHLESPPIGEGDPEAVPEPQEMLRFQPDGRTTGGVIVLTDTQGQQRRVVIAPETAAVRIEAVAQ